MFGDPFLEAWTKWWLPDAVGIFVVTPLAIRVAITTKWRRPSLGRTIELVTLCAGALLVAGHIFLADAVVIPLSVGVLPVLIWAALRFGVAGVSLVSLLIWLVGSYATARGHGPFSTLGATTAAHMAWMHIYVAVTGGSMLAIAATIAERRQIGAALRESVEELRDAYTRAQAIIASAPNMLAAVDRDMRLLAFNPAWADEFVRLCQRRPSIGIDLTAVLGEVDSPWARAALSGWQRAVNGERFAIRRGPEVLGSAREMLAEFSPILDEDDRVIGVVQVLRDVTEERRHQTAEAQARRLESVGRLAGGVAHDFNNIITGIQGFAQLLADTLPVGHKAHDDLAEIKKAGLRAAALTRQLLAFARRQVIEPRQVAVAELLTGLSSLLKRLIGEDVTLEFKDPGTLWPVLADPGQLEQVIMNLAVNARDAMPNGGRLVIESVNAAAGGAEAQAMDLATGDYVVISVRDTGSGMPPDVLERIFEPFYTTKQSGMGTGLGLATSDGIVRQLGGAITAESAVGVGTTFRVYLPRDRSAAARESPSTPAVARSERGREHILLVEDDDSLRPLTSRVLERQGFTVDAFPGGTEALAVSDAALARASLLLTDIVLPGLNGRDLAGRLRDRAPHLRVLLVSGYTEGALRPGMRDEEFNFLAKPFSPEQLLQKVRAVLDAAHPLGA
jgi:signal transduction histidine kinase/ActR/RegA family two-component response regulator